MDFYPMSKIISLKYTITVVSQNFINLYLKKETGKEWIFYVKLNQFEKRS